MNTRNNREYIYHHLFTNNSLYSAYIHVVVAAATTGTSVTILTILAAILLDLLDKFDSP